LDAVLPLKYVPSFRRGKRSEYGGDGRIYIYRLELDQLSKTLLPGDNAIAHLALRPEIDQFKMEYPPRHGNGDKALQTSRNQ